MNKSNHTVDITREKLIPALWRQAFRPFFLAGSLFSILAMATWVTTLSGQLVFTPYANILFWHGHEMLFGFMGAIIVGFLLTAVQSWTGLRATHGKPLLMLFALWLIARLLMVTGAPGVEWAVVIIDISFFPVAGALVAQLVIKGRSYHNLQFIPVLGMLALANLLTHLSIILHKPELFAWGMYAAIMLVSLLMVVVGGRVIPLFTANGTQTALVKPLPWLEKAVLVSTWLIVLLYISNGISMLSDHLLAVIFAIAASSNAYRVFRWRGWKTLSNALVWSLHLAYWFIPVGFGLFALHFAGFDVDKVTALHSLTAGAMGSLILTMITRVSQGHTGRPLIAHQSMKYAFVFIFIAGFTRLLIGLYPILQTSNSYIISASFWIVAYGIYLIGYFRILTTPRPDGNPG